MSGILCRIRGHLWTLLAGDRRPSRVLPGFLEYWRCERCPAVQTIRRSSLVLELTPPDAGGIDAERLIFGLFVVGLVLAAGAMVALAVRA